MQRRLFIAASCLAGCASGPEEQVRVATPGQPLLWRRLQGGFVAPALAAPGSLPRPAGGLYVRWMRPGAVALRGNEVLVADVGTGRLWRTDTVGNQVTSIAGAVASVNTALALGPDLSAWVLDTALRQVLRFGRDGRLMQSYSIGITSPGPVGFALADGGATLMLADGMAALWSEQRSPGSFVRSVLPTRQDGVRVSGVDALVLASDGVFVLDRLQAVVYRTTRQGQVLQTLGQGELLQPMALAADRLDRVHVWDAQDGSIKRLRPGAPALRWTAAELGVQQIGGLAIDGLMLAVTDAVEGQVVLHSLAHDTAP